MPDFASWYDANPDKTSLYQGDVLDDIPLIFIPDRISKWLVLRAPENAALTDVDAILGGQIPKWFRAQAEGSVRNAWTFGNGEEFVAAKARKSRVIVVTQTCDLVQRSIYQVAPVLTAAGLGPKDKENLQLNNFQYMFYIPARPPGIVEDSYADFSQIQGVPRTYFKPDAVIARFTEATRRDFQSQIAEFYGRPFGFNTRDRSPHNAEYGCVRCYYEHFRLVKIAAIKGNRFPECEACGDGLWVRISDAVQGDLDFRQAASATGPFVSPTASSEEQEK